MNHALYLTVNVFSTAVSILDTRNKETYANIVKQTETFRRIPTFSKEASWLLTERRGVELEATEDKFGW